MYPAQASVAKGGKKGGCRYVPTYVSTCIGGGGRRRRRGESMQGARNGKLGGSLSFAAPPPPKQGCSSSRLLIQAGGRRSMFFSLPLSLRTLGKPVIGSLYNFPPPSSHEKHVYFYSSVFLSLEKGLLLLVTFFCSRCKRH